MQETKNQIRSLLRPGAFGGNAAAREMDARCRLSRTRRRQYFMFSEAINESCTY